MVILKELPEFRSHGFDTKFEALTAEDFEPDMHTSRYIDYLRQWSSKPLDQCVILDLGCGRGGLVGAMRKRGVRAFGVEVDPRFIESGRILNEVFPDDFDALSVLDTNGRSQFPDSFFDLVISDQVLEHVADLNVVVAEISRLLVPGGKTVHQFPARFRVVEPHFLIPFAHWMPKATIRWHYIRLMLWLGLGRRFFPTLDISARADIIYRYSIEETFYRGVREIKSAFVSGGLIPSFREGMEVLMSVRFGKVPLASLMAGLFAAFRGVMFTAAKPTR